MGAIFVCASSRCEHYRMVQRGRVAREVLYEAIGNLHFCIYECHPKTQGGQDVYYSKRHFDIVKGIATPVEPQYYTIPEAKDMKLMGIENTHFIIARHIDRDHPHCHIVYNRVDNDGRTISDKNDRFRNEKMCKMLTARYRLHFSEGKKNVKFDRLRKHDQVKHYIYHVLRHEVPKAIYWSELRRALRRYKIDTEFKLNRRTGEAEGVKFICIGYKFSGSKIDRQFSLVNIACRLEENAFDAGIYPRRNSTPIQQREEPRKEVVRQEPSEESSLSAGLLDLTIAPATDPEEEMLAKQYVKKKKKPQRKRGFRL